MNSSHNIWSTKAPCFSNTTLSTKKVPVLVDNGNPLPESLVILKYINEVFLGTPILPKDPCERATARFWSKFIQDKFLHVAKNPFFTTGEEQEKGKDEICEVLKILDNELKNKKFFGGETFGFADINANFLALWLGVFEQVFGVDLGFTEEKLPNLCRWKEDLLNCDVIRESLPPRDKLVGFYNERFKAAA